VQCALSDLLYYTVSQKKQDILPTRVGNFAKYYSIFKILSLLDSAQKLLQNGHYTSHHTLKTLLHYLVKPWCFKNRINSKIHYWRKVFRRNLCAFTYL